MTGYFLKVRRCFFAALLLCLPSLSLAQDPVKLYDEMCDPLQSVFCDYVAREASVNTIDDAAGKYIGTVIDDGLYGWGVFYSSTGVKSYGQYANNQLIFGIVMSDKVAKVGSLENYILYELETGEVLLLSRKRHMPTEIPFSVNSTRAAVMVTAYIATRTVTYGMASIRAVTGTGTVCCLRPMRRSITASGSATERSNEIIT